MLSNFVIKRGLRLIITSLKGKKRWLAILVLAAAVVAQSAGINLDGSLGEFIAELMALIEAPGA